MRRSALNPYFSMASVTRLQPVIQERLDVMLKRMNEFKNTGDVLNMSYMFSALGNGKKKKKKKNSRVSHC